MQRGFTGCFNRYTKVSRSLHGAGSLNGNGSNFGVTVTFDGSACSGADCTAADYCGVAAVGLDGRARDGTDCAINELHITGNSPARGSAYLAAINLNLCVAPQGEIIGADIAARRHHKEAFSVQMY
ncbi:hypothetical protein SDC9_159594 [bioreactor metagenome]|uniref:Uncharacterized protein n=1 Tax=bioreactor metagenome TaxID=1076179 RepID=A0A645FD06_9ZZZZ